MTNTPANTATPKPWIGARLMQQNRKSNVRKYWTRKRWQRYDAERDQRRERAPRPQLKVTRLRRAAEAASYEARRVRMTALNEKRREQRRAAKLAELTDIAMIVVRGILDNLDVVHSIMRERGMIEIAPGHWRDDPRATTQPCASSRPPKGWKPSW